MSEGKICSCGRPTNCTRDVCHTCRYRANYPDKFRIYEVPFQHGTILSVGGEEAIKVALKLGATALLAEEVTMPDGTVLPINTPMKQRPDGYWEVVK